MQYLANKYWALESGFFDRVSPLIFNWVKAGKSIEDFPLAKQKKAYLGDDMEEYSDPAKGYTPYQVKDNVAIIPIQGTITPKGDLCSYGIDEIIGWIQHANNNRDVAAIVTDTDSFGGSVSGIQTLYNSIKKSAKPVVAFANNEMHSAGYWGNSGASHIMASSLNSTFIGSIGVYMMHQDVSKMAEAEGISVTYITSDKSVHKTIGNPYEPLSEEAKRVLKDEVNRIHMAFISDIEALRLTSKKRGDDNYTGGSWDGEESIERGLVDSIAENGLESAIDTALRIANKSGIKTPKSSMYSFKVKKI